MSGRTNLSGGIDTADATAVAGDVVSPKTFYSASGVKLTGTIAIKTLQTFTPTTTNQTITAGQYLGGDQTILGDTDLTPGNIKNGISIFDVVGTFTGFGSDFFSGGVSFSRINAAGQVMGGIGLASSTFLYPLCSRSAIPRSHTGSDWVGKVGALMSDDGSKIIAFVNSTNVSNSFRYSTDYGKTWTTGAALPSTSSFGGACAIAANSDLSAVYIIDSTGQKFYKSTNYCASLSDITSLLTAGTPSATSGAPYHEVCCSADGTRVYVLYRTTGANYVIMGSSNSGASFSSLKSDGFTRKDLICSPNGQYVFYRETQSGTGIYKSSAYGASFASTGYTNAQLLISCDNSGNLYAASTTFSAGTIVYKNDASYINNGQSGKIGLITDTILYGYSTANPGYDLLKDSAGNINYLDDIGASMPNTTPTFGRVCPFYRTYNQASFKGIYPYERNLKIVL
jgi:hypothetical protein